MGPRLKFPLLAAALATALAACGSAAPPPEPGLKVGDVRTEFRTAAGVSVVCNDTTQLDGSHTSQTGLTLRFASSGPVSSATVVLRGTASHQYDAFYTRTLTNDQLGRRRPAEQAPNAAGSGAAANGTPATGQAWNRYRVRLTANAPSALYLSSGAAAQALSVGAPGPGPVVKRVQTSGLQSGGFSVQLQASGPQTMTASATSPGSVPVYDRCTVLSESGERL